MTADPQQPRTDDETTTPGPDATNQGVSPVEPAEGAEDAPSGGKGSPDDD